MKSKLGLGDPKVTLNSFGISNTPSHVMKLLVGRRKDVTWNPGTFFPGRRYRFLCGGYVVEESQFVTSGGIERNGG